MCPVTPDPKHMRSYLTIEQPRESAHEGRIKKDVLYYYEKYQKHRPFKPRTYKSDDRIDCLGGTFPLKALENYSESVLYIQHRYEEYQSYVQEFIKNQEEKEKMKTEATKTLKNLKVGDKVRIRKDLKAGTFYADCFCTPEKATMGGTVCTVFDFSEVTDNVRLAEVGYYWNPTKMLELVDDEPQDCQSTPPAPPNTPVIFTREELNTRVVKLLEEVIEKFKGKNASYGDTKEGFYNFKATAERFSHLLGTNVLEAQFNDALILFDKHWVTLAKNGINDPECEDRLGDMIVYGALMSVMKQQQRASEGGTEELEELEVTETPLFDLQNMTREEAMEALGKEWCEKITNMSWPHHKLGKSFIFLTGGKLRFSYGETREVSDIRNAFSFATGWAEYKEEPPIDLLNMTYAEAKEALRQGKCTKIQCKQWWLREEPFICLEGSKFLYRDTTGFSEEVIEGYKNFTDSSKSIWYAID